MPKPLPSNIETGPGQGAGRPGPPGPPGAGFSAGLDLTGTSSEQAVVGFLTRPLSTNVPVSGDAYVFDGTEWVPQPAGGGGGGTVPPLTSFLFVDAGSVAVTPDGSVGKPFPSIQSALNVVNGSPGVWGLFVSPGSYDGSLNLSGGVQLSIYSPGYGLVKINQSLHSSLNWSISSQSSLTLRNVILYSVSTSNGASVPPNVGTLFLDNSSVQNISCGTFEVDLIISGPDSFVNNAVMSGSVRVNGANFVQGLTGTSVDVKSTFVQNNITAISGNMILEGCQFDNSSHVIMSGYLQSLYMDATTYYWFHEIGVSVAGTNVTTKLVDSGTTIHNKTYNADSSGYTYNVVPADAGRCVSINSSGSAVTAVIPKGMPPGCTVYFYQANVQRVTLSGASGVSVFSSVSGPTGVSTYASGSIIWAYQVSTDFWIVSGDLQSNRFPPSRPTDHDTTFNPSALWQFNETLSDTSGNGFDLTISAGPTTQYTDIYPSVRGLYLLSGLTAAHTTTTPAGLQISGDITIECLVDFTVRNVSHPFFACDAAAVSSASNRQYGVAFDSNGFPTWSQEHGTQDSTGGTFTCTEMFPPRLCHFAVTRISNVIQFYCNGLPLGSASGTLTTPTGGGSSVFRLGQGSSPTGEGILRSLKIVAAGLSAAQVKAEYNRCLGNVFWTDP